MSKNIIRWFESPALDKPYLKSPQPCKRGVHCDYKLKDEASGELVRACCSGVHPGEEGTGRRLFPARTLDDGRKQPACVRLTGASQGFYERRRLRMSWAEWCEKNGWDFTPALPGQPFQPLVRMPLGDKKIPDFSADQVSLSSIYRPVQRLDPRMQSRGFLGMPGGAEAARIASTPQSPSRLSLSGGRTTQRFAVSRRGGECSPDCCCPSGVSCHDRLAPSTPRFALEDESGSTILELTTPLTGKGDFESLD